MSSVPGDWSGETGGDRADRSGNLSPPELPGGASGPTSRGSRRRNFEIVYPKANRPQPGGILTIIHTRKRRAGTQGKPVEALEGSGVVLHGLG